MDKKLFIDIHAIQTVPPSCVNRDDTGSPKTAIYGGVERARVSSQAWKHAMREYFKEIFAPEELGSRTKHIPEMIAKEIMTVNPDFDEKKALKSAMDALKAAGIKTDDKKNENSALFFISNSQVKALAELAAEGEKDKSAFKKVMKDYPSFDIVLFGRMVADLPDINYDATAQVAHAISTHAVHTEYDYFTAVDDEKADDQSGAGHLGTIEFNSSTLYRYAAINASELEKHLEEDAARVIKGFAEAFIRSMPTGKQNTFANRTLPDMVYITARSDQPVNLSGAFESAIKNSKNGYAEASCKALLSYAQKMYSTFADKPEIALGCGDGELLAGYAEALPLNEMLGRLESYTAEVYKKVEE
ncbi:MAG: type I-E CRISPR-associated protein Cas7/Cse4/CasC [Clostridia bacterium]|nr:type I-E CRISPR-associated protein Cas7/Cse4/CasC [Clostridia bacterium]